MHSPPNVKNDQKAGVVGPRWVGSITQVDAAACRARRHAALTPRITIQGVRTRPRRLSRRMGAAHPREAMERG